MAKKKTTFDVKTHILVPKHVKLSQKDKKELFERLNITIKELPKISVKDPVIQDMGVEVGDVFNPFNYVFRAGEEQVYAAYMKDHYTGRRDMDDPPQLARYYKHPWRKNQISDHFPIWFELIIDSSDEFLKDKLGSYQ